MPRPISRVDSSWFDDAREAMRSARVRAAATCIDSAFTTSPEALRGDAIVLRMRCHLRLDAVAAVAYACDVAPSLRSREIRAAMTMLEGAAHARLGDSVSAESCFAKALEIGSHDPVVLAEIAYHRASSKWIERELDAAEVLLAKDAAAFARASGTGDRSVALLVAILRGAIAGSRGEFERQAATLLDALSTVGDRATTDVYLWATIVEQIASLGRELPSAALRAAALEELPRIPWSDEIAHLRFLATRSIGWCHALDGDSFNAFRRLKEAATCAPTDAWRVMAFCDRSYLAETLGESRWSAQELSDAHELASRIDWETCRGDDLAALVLLAERYAKRDRALALAYLGRYRSSRGNIDRTRSSRDDRRVDALESYSFGIVQHARGNSSEARRLLEHAWRIYDAIGYDWRAGRTALALAETTRDPIWLERAVVKLRPYQSSWLGSSLADARNSGDSSSEPTTAAITPAQALVFEKLLEGLGNAAIAAELGRSEFTIRNHVKAIFHAYGVRSRAELLAKTLHRPRVRAHEPHP